METMRTGLFPAGNQPDIFTFHAARGLLPPDLAAAIVKESALARLPGIRQVGQEPGRWRYLLPVIYPAISAGCGSTQWRSGRWKTD